MGGGGKEKSTIVNVGVQGVTGKKEGTPTWRNQKHQKERKKKNIHVPISVKKSFHEKRR